MLCVVILCSRSSGVEFTKFGRNIRILLSARLILDLSISWSRWRVSCECCVPWKSRINRLQSNLTQNANIFIKKMISKCHLQNVDHFVSVSMFQWDMSITSQSVEFHFMCHLWQYDRRHFNNQLSHRCTRLPDCLVAIVSWVAALTGCFHSQPMKSTLTKNRTISVRLSTHERPGIISLMEKIQADKINEKEPINKSIFYQTANSARVWIFTVLN